MSFKTEANIFVRPLTEKDCEQGYHVFDKMQESAVSFTEKCKICNQVVTYSIGDMYFRSPERDKWVKNHKLDLLQPYGATREKFIYYYGDKKISKDNTTV